MSKALVPKLRFSEFREAGEWEECPLGSEANFFKGRGVSKAEVDPTGDRPCIRYGELYTRYGEIINSVHSRTNVPKADLFLSQRNDVIIPASGETKEDIATASCVTLDDVALGSDINVLRTGHNGIFLSYLINGRYRRAIAKVAQGDTVVHLYPSQLATVSVALPNVPEQQKIADCLTSLDEVIAAEGRKLEALRTFKKGLLQNLFPRGTGNEKFEGRSENTEAGEPFSLPTSHFSHLIPHLRFPEFRTALEWEDRSLGDHGALSSGGTPAMNNPEYWNGDIPWISASSMHDTLIWDAPARVTRKAIGNGTRIAEAGSILILVRGSMLFKRVPICMAMVDVAFNQDVKALRMGPQIDPTFLLFSLISSEAIIPVDRTGIGAGKIELDELKALSIPVPTLGEQQRIASCLSSLDALITAQAKKLDTLRVHKQGLMQSLFPAMEAG
ncbi:MAG: restriction endonuclease subunit S [Fimbriimonadaceae bacterium]